MLSPAFDDWLAVERVRRADERRALVIGAARCAIAAKHWGEARQLANAYLGVEPTDPDAAQIAMRAAAEAGDAGDARRVYARHAAALRCALDAVPLAETIALLGDLSGDGGVARTRKRGGVRRLPATLLAPFAPTPDPPETVTPTLRRPARSRRRQAVIAGVVVAGLAAIGGAHFYRAPGTVPITLVRVETLAAAPSDPEGRAVGVGLGSAVARNLIGSETPVQIIDSGAPGAVSVPLIVRGNAMNDHGTLRANVELVSGSTGQLLWAGKYDRPMAELDQFEDQVGLQIAHQLYCAYSNGRGPYFDSDVEMARLTLAHCDSLGRDAESALRYDAQITKRAPQYARGWAEYATDTTLVAYRLPPALQAAANDRARAYAQRALALDPHEGLAYAAITKTMNGAMKWIAREQITARGLAADPDEPMLHSFHYDSLAEVGRLQEALGEERLTIEREHFFPGPMTKMIQGELHLGDTRRARDYLAAGRRFYPHHRWIEDAALELESSTGGSPVEALRLLNERPDKDDADWIDFRAYLMWRLAPSPASEATAERAIEAAGRTLGFSPIQAQLLGKMGQIDAAYRVVDRLPSSVAPDPDWFVPDLARFRADPRFMAFAARTGLTRIWLTSGKWPDFCSEEKLRYDCKASAQAAAR